MISGFGFPMGHRRLSSLAGPGIGRNRAKSDVEKMANGNMADGKCAGRVSEAVMEGKAPEKTKKRQAHSKSFAGSDGALVLRQFWVGNGQAVSRKTNPHPGPLPSDGRGRVSAGRGVPRAAFVPHWPWAIFVHPCRILG